jgi:bacterioferritin (cytochrome b1)
MTKESIDGLNSLLRDEISAAETYTQALAKAPSGAVRDVFALCQTDHQKRAQRLTERITELGGKPCRDAGPWGTFVKLITAGASILGERSAIAILEEGEDLGRISYETTLKKLDPGSMEIVQRELLPAQSNTHQLIQDLNQGLAGMLH